MQRLQQLLATKARPNEKALRLTVEAGGCSGFSYRCVPSTNLTRKPAGFTRSAVMALQAHLAQHQTLQKKSQLPV